MVIPITLTPELMENLRHRWENTDEPMTTIAIDAGVYHSTMRRLAKRWGWKPRKRDAPRDLSDVMKLGLVAKAALDAPPEHDSKADDPALPLAERLENAVEKELAAVERLRVQLGTVPTSPVDSQRTAQTLASLTETLFKVQRLRSPETSAMGPIDDSSADADDFRLTLAARIDVFIRNRTDACVAGAGERPGVEPAGG